MYLCLLLIVIAILLLMANLCWISVVLWTSHNFTQYYAQIHAVLKKSPPPVIIEYIRFFKPLAFSGPGPYFLLQNQQFDLTQGSIPLNSSTQHLLTHKSNYYHMSALTSFLFKYILCKGHSLLPFKIQRTFSRTYETCYL